MIKKTTLILLCWLPNLWGESQNIKIETVPPSEVVVAKFDKNFPENSDLHYDFLWENFFNKPEEERFSDYTTKSWKTNFTKFTEELVEKASRLDLDAESLNRSIYLALADAKGEIAYLPVAAYETSYRGKKVWIILIKWEYPYESEKDSAFGLGHLRAYVYMQETLELVAFTTCM